MRVFISVTLGTVIVAARIARAISPDPDLTNNTATATATVHCQAGAFST
jgi:hypothetical protein